MRPTGDYSSYGVKIVVGVEKRWSTDSNVLPGNESLRRLRRWEALNRTYSNKVLLLF